MASVIYNEAKRAIAAGEIDLGGDDIRVALLMANTTADTENDGITTVDGFATLDECDSAGYARQALAGEAVNKDDANDRAEFDADDVTWTALAACTRTVPGALVYKHVTDDTDSVPIAWVEFPVAITPDGSDFTIQWNAEGILQLS
ncbi:MAG: hypothetical protein HQ581_11935 [Planctomycetes bacterium]|nr:hypothetical protein [Planctomycetota bacterium]